MWLILNKSKNDYSKRLIMQYGGNARLGKFEVQGFLGFESNIVVDDLKQSFSTNQLISGIKNKITGMSCNLPTINSY